MPRPRACVLDQAPAGSPPDVWLQQHRQVVAARAAAERRGRVRMLELAAATRAGAHFESAELRRQAQALERQQAQVLATTAAAA